MFGNYLVPTTLSINIGDAHVVYTTKPASTPFDQFMHVVKCKLDNMRIMLVPSPKYQGVRDEYVCHMLLGRGGGRSIHGSGEGWGEVYTW